MRHVTPGRYGTPALLAGLAFVGGFGMLAACNLLTGVNSLSAAGCPDCDPGASSGSNGVEGGASSGGEGGGFDAAFDGPFIPQPGGFVDTSFGNKGVVLSTLLDTVTSVAVRADGKIVVAGSSAGQLAVVRFDSTGALDLGFSTNGRVTAGTLTSSRADAVAIDSQGRILAGGIALNVDPQAVTTQFAYVVRIVDSGVDPSFAAQGRRTFTTDGEAVTSLVALATDGCLVGGRANGPGGTVGAVWQLSAQGSYVMMGAVARSDVSYITGAPSTITAMVGGLNSLLVVGSVTSFGGGSDFAAARLLAGGLDTTFDGDGKVVVPVGTAGDNALAAAAFSDGTYLVGGEVAVPGGGILGRTPQLGLVRLQNDSSLSPTWGTGGKAIVTFEVPGQLASKAGDYLRGVAVDAHDRVIAVGYGEEPGNMTKRRALALRLDTNGQKDLFFGSFGVTDLFPDPARPDARATAVALQPDGKIVVVGTASGQLAMTRLLP